MIKTVDFQQAKFTHRYGNITEKPYETNPSNILRNMQTLPPYIELCSCQGEGKQKPLP